MKSIRNVIFDLGGVIFNVDYHLTLKAFQELGAKDFDKIYTQLKQTTLFDDLETGKITPEAFRQQLKQELNAGWKDEQIDAAWNAMLLDLPRERLELIQKLSKKFRLFLLSNTNAIHLPEVQKIISSSLGIRSFNGYFEKEYYSHLIGMRKPDVQVFEMILKENNLQREVTLFVDDSPQHIEGAKKAGLNTLHITKGKDILNEFSHWLEN